MSPSQSKTPMRNSIPEAERKCLAGVTAQYESEVVYHKIVKTLNKESFSVTWTPLREYPEIVRAYFGKLSLQTTTNSLL